MDPTRLPYEVQFNYLMLLSDSEILGYCRLNITAAQICQTDYFWERRARQQFNLPLDLVNDPSPVRRYLLLREMYLKRPDQLILFLLRRGEFEQIPELFYRFFQLNDIQSFDDALFRLVLLTVKSGRPESLDYLLSYLISAEAPKYHPIEAHVFREALLGAIMMNRPDLIAVIRRYYDPATDYEIEFAHFEAIRRGDLPIVKYLLPFMEGLGIELSASFEEALRLDKEEILKYLLTLSPGAFSDPEFVRSLVEPLIDAGDQKTLEKVIQRARPVINFDQAHHYALEVEQPLIAEYLSKFQ